MSDTPDSKLATGERVLLVPSFAVRRRGLDEARRTLLAAAERRENLHAIHEIARSQSFAASLRDDEAIEIVAQLIADGRLVCIELERPLGTWSRGRADGQHDAAWDDIPRMSDLAPGKLRDWIEIRCIGTAGGSFAGAPVRLRLPGGEIVERRVGAGSVLRIDDLRSGGACRFEMLGGARRQGAVPLPERPALGTGGTRVRRGGPPVDLATGARHLVLVEERRAFSW